MQIHISHWKELPLMFFCLQNIIKMTNKCRLWFGLAQQLIFYKVDHSNSFQLKQIICFTIYSFTVPHYVLVY